jgi:hypothetical protein
MVVSIYRPGRILAKCSASETQISAVYVVYIVNLGLLSSPFVGFATICRFFLIGNHFLSHPQFLRQLTQVNKKLAVFWPYSIPGRFFDDQISPPSAPPTSPAEPSIEYPTRLPPRKIKDHLGPPFPNVMESAQGSPGHGQEKT